jgi:hypothetical protein
MFCQGFFYIVTGSWPFFSRKSFEKISGRKTDWWLVITLGLIITVIGSVLIIASFNSITKETVILANGTAASLLFVDLFYVSKNIIPKIYLADALIESVFLIGWIMTKTVSFSQ